MIRKLFLTAALLATYTANAVDNPLSFYSDKAATVGLVVYDINNQSEVFNYNGNLSMIPASTMKLVTSAAALSAYPSDYQYETPAYIDGGIIDGVALGDLVIKGSGDPTLYSRHFPDNQTFIEDIVNALTELGVKKIAGNIVVDGADVPNQGKLPTWEIEDGYYEYGTGWYQFNFRDNSFKLKPSDMITVPDCMVTDNIINEIDGKLYLNQSFGTSYNEVSGISHFTQKTTLRLPNPYPQDLFITELTNLLGDSGIQLVNEDDAPENETAASDSIHVASYYSPALKAILTDMMYRSDNMMAESALRLLAPGKTIEEALGAEKQFYESNGISTDLFTIRDGSGLSRGNNVSPEFLVKVLTLMAGNEDYVDLFPRAGVSGTVRNTFKGSVLEGRMALKNGTMSGVRCYAGYLLDDEDNPKYAVAIMVNNFRCKLQELNKTIEEFLLNYYNN